MNTGLPGNPTASDSSSQPRRIQDYESDALTSRIRAVIGDKKVTWFATECGVGESTLRNILNGALPRTDILVSIARAGGVTVDWLATGQGPKTRADLRAAQSQSQVHAGGEPVPAARIDPALLRQCLAACTMVYGAPFAAAAVARQVEHAADLYNAMLPNVGPRLTLQDIASREPAGLAEMLRGFLALGAVRPFS